MLRAALFVLGIFVFGASLRQCLAHERTYECTQNSRKQKDDECYGKSPGTHVQRGLFSDLDAAGGMLCGLVVIGVAAIMKRKK